MSLLSDLTRFAKPLLPLIAACGYSIGPLCSLSIPHLRFSSSYDRFELGDKDYSGNLQSHGFGPKDKEQIPRYCNHHHRAHYYADANRIEKIPLVLLSASAFVSSTARYCCMNGEISHAPIYCGTAVKDKLRQL